VAPSRSLRRRRAPRPRSPSPAPSGSTGCSSRSDGRAWASQSRRPAGTCRSRSPPWRPPGLPTHKVNWPPHPTSAASLSSSATDNWPEPGRVSGRLHAGWGSGWEAQHVVRATDEVDGAARPACVRGGPPNTRFRRAYGGLNARFGWHRSAFGWRVVLPASAGFRINATTKRANPSWGGDAKLRDLRGQPGYRK